MKKEWRKKVEQKQLFNIAMPLLPQTLVLSCPNKDFCSVILSLSLFTYIVNITYAFVSYVSRKMFYHCFSHKFSHERRDTVVGSYNKSMDKVLFILNWTLILLIHVCVCVPHQYLYYNIRNTDKSMIIMYAWKVFTVSKILDRHRF